MAAQLADAGIAIVVGVGPSSAIGVSLGSATATGTSPSASSTTTLGVIIAFGIDPTDTLQVVIPGVVTAVAAGPARGFAAAAARVTAANGADAEADGREFAIAARGGRV
jgi:hypothetical protein